MVRDHGGTLRACLLASMVVLGGCSTFVGQPKSTQTVTPAPIPAESHTTTATPVAVPGISADGVVNATALGLAHTRSLAGTSYTRRSTLQIRYRNGSIHAGFTRILRMGRSTDRFRFSETRRGAMVSGPSDAVRIVIRSTEAGVTQTIRFRNGTTVHRSLSTGDSVPTLLIGQPSVDRIVTFFRDVDATVDARSDGRPGITVMATGLSPTALPILVSPPRRDARLRARIRPTGFVEQLNLSYEFQRGTSPLELRWHVDYTAVGTTTPDLPTGNSAIARSSTGG